MPGTPEERNESLDVIQRELTAFARRARPPRPASTRSSLVSYTLLAHIEDQHGCRATDLAAHYMLDKSTVSRQIGTLEKLGLVERHPDPDDHRIQVLHPTAAGTQALASTQASRRMAYQERLADWTEEDLARFAKYLLRYNSAGDTVPPAQQTPKA